MAPAKNPWYPRVSKINFTTMSSNIRSSLSSTRRLPANAVAYEVRLINSSEKVKLLRAPSIESDVVWKARSLQFACTALRKRLGSPHSAEDLISVISEHFPAITQQAELDAEAIVTKFRGCFGDVTYLSPLGFFNANGDDVTEKIHKTRRPVNVCFLETKFELPLSRLGAPFSVYQRCDMSYWLHLPQSCPQIKTASVATASSIISPSDTRKSLFSVATNLQSKFTFNPEVELTEDTAVPLSPINLGGNTTATTSENCSTAASASKAGITAGDSGDASGDSNASEGGSNGFPSTSNTGFTEINLKLHPKTVELLTNRRAHGSASLRSYHGELDILENQSAFNDAGNPWNEMFRLGVNPAGQTDVVEYKNIRKEIEEMEQEILFEVFCHKSTDAYVGQAFCKDKIVTTTIEQVQVSLNYFKMEYYDKAGKLIITTPDTVFNKMLDYLPILPDDARKWTFCLSSVYYNALSEKIRNRITVDKYTVPQPSLLAIKEDQLRIMTLCRAWAVKALARIGLVEDSVQNRISREITGLCASGNFVQQTHQQQQQQADDTIRQEQYKKKRALDLPSGCVQSFVTADGLQYPCHPEDVGKYSQFPMDFRGCLGCGNEHHDFSDCPNKRDPNCYKKFYWNLHCHKPDIFFRNRRRKSKHFTPQRLSSSLSSYGPSQQFQQEQQQQTLPTLTQGNSLQQQGSAVPYFAQNQQSTQAPRSAMGRGNSPTLPAWMGQQTPGQTRSADIRENPPFPPRASDNDGLHYAAQDSNFAHEYVQMVLNFRSTNLRPMPITSQNELAHIKWLIWAADNKELIGLSMLYDTGSALNTGYLPYHSQIVKCHPSVVKRLEYFDGSNPFEPIKLCGAITQPSDYDSGNHGILSAVVEYHTPYKYRNGEPVSLTIALGNSMTVNTILGLPTIREGELEPRWSKQEYISHVYQARFPIEYVATKRADIPESKQSAIKIESAELSPINVSTSLQATFVDASKS